MSLKSGIVAAEVLSEQIGRRMGRPKVIVREAGWLTAEMSAAAKVAAAEVAAAEPAHMAEIGPGEVTAAKAARVAAGKAAEMAGAEAARVAEIAPGEVAPAPVESEAAVVEAVVEAAASEEDRTTKPVAIVVVWIRVSVTIGVARAIIRPVVVIATVRIVRIPSGRAGDHSGGDARAGIIAVVGVAVSVSPNVVAMAYVATCDIPMACVAAGDIPVKAMRDPRVSSVPVVVSNSRRICGRNRRR